MTDREENLIGAWGMAVVAAACAHDGHRWGEGFMLLASVLLVLFAILPEEK